MKRSQRIYCRSIQCVIRMVHLFMPYREPKILRSTGEVPTILREEGIERVMIITDLNLNRMGRVNRLKHLLAENGIGYAVYDRTSSNPLVQNVEDACELYRSGKCQGLIGFGGGASMDCAKMVGARIARPQMEFSDMKGILKIRKKIPILIAIPTTTGMGSEVSDARVISDSVGHDKFLIRDFCLIPKVAVLDAENAKDMPPFCVALTGMDALTHAVEAYLNHSTMESRQEALRAVGLIFENVEAFYRNSEDLSAGQKMLEAAYLAGDAFSKSYVGYVHAIAHSLRDTYGLPHGLCCAVLMPYVLEAYGEATHKKLHRLGVAAGVALESDRHDKGARNFISALKGLNGRLGICRGFSEIRREDIPAMAARAAMEVNPRYPVPVLMDGGELELLYERVMTK